MAFITHNYSDDFMNNYTKHKVGFKNKALAINGSGLILLDPRKVKLKMFQRCEFSPDFDTHCNITNSRLRLLP